MQDKIITCPACDSFETTPSPYGENIYECVKCGTVFGIEKGGSDK